MNEAPPGFKPSEAPSLYQRAIPAVLLGRAWFIAAAVFGTALLAWELNWRAWGAQPAYRNSDGSWAMQWRRLHTGEGKKTVLLGASRVLFSRIRDLCRSVWAEPFDEPIPGMETPADLDRVVNEQIDRIHFEDHAELQGLTTPEWSHLASGDASKFTEALCTILRRDFGW